jgi:predicted component of type VI protein secretion system
MLVILATQEAEIRKIVVQSQPQANSIRDPISKILNTKKDWQSGSSARVPVL